MNCDDVSTKLSEYMDDELDLKSSELISLHIVSCMSCQCELQSHQRLGQWMRENELTVDTEATWNQIESALPNKKRFIAGSFVVWGAPILAVAASIIFLLANTVFKPISVFKTIDDQSVAGIESHGQHAHDRDSLAVDFRQVIELAQTSPTKAIASLVDKYNGKQLAAEDATRFIGYSPSLFDNIPVGFSRVSTHVLDMPCCKCTASICARQDGRSLIVFEHKDEQPVWFGELPSIQTQCSGTQCLIIESAGQLAVSWRQKDRQFTMIGASDLSEINQWVESMKL